jgi:hypothetical protein
MRREKWRARSVSCADSSPHPHSTRACGSSSGCRSDFDINDILAGGKLTHDETVARSRAVTA